jgi:Tol biopolymer transport system component
MAGKGVSRRGVLAASGGVGLALAGGASVAKRGPGRVALATGIDVVVTEATNAALTVSPDGGTIAFDVLGILWTIPVGGGPARRLTGDYDDIAQPDWSPDGKRIAFQSYRTGNFHIWSIAPDGTGLTQHTHGAFDHREVRWSPDGRTIAFSSDRGEGRYAIHLLDVASGKVTLFSKGEGQASEPAWSPDGKRMAYVVNGAKIVMAGLDGSAEQVASTRSSADRPQWSELRAPSFAPDGTLAYTRVEASGVTLVVGGKDTIVGEDLYPFRPAWLPGGGCVYGATGHIRAVSASGARSIVPFTLTAPVSTPNYTKRRRDFDSAARKPAIGIASPVLSPDGRSIAFAALNQLWLLPIGGKPAKLTDDRWYKCHPAWSPDGKTLAYSSDRGGTLQLWLRDMANGSTRQLTNLANAAAVSATWSQDGALIAFLTQDGELHTVEVASGAVQKVYDALWEPGRPSFGPGARTIAMAAFKPVSARYREGLSEILTVDRATGEGVYAPVLPGKSLGTRGDDGPVWSPDGKTMAFVFASTLWTVPVDAAGTFTFEPTRINAEVTDAISWSGDSRSILYLSNGKLRLIAAAGGKPRNIPCRLDWANARPAGRTIVRAGKLWDADGPAYRRDMEVLIDGNRIGAVIPKGSVSDANAKLIDGSRLTLMPGLIDMHTHRQMQGYAYGDRMGRLWLAMGVTTTRSPGCPAYHMVEDREALDSGARIGARHYATGEAIDGSRIFYNFMRPVTEPGQMALELSRADALSYDMVKTYVRLPHADQAKVARAAHAMGMHLSSHYHYPALHSGMDCVEHMGATSRNGYSRTITSLGGGYQDVNALFAAARAGRVPTLFNARVLLGEDDGLVRDARIRALYPAWDYAKLEAFARATKDSDRAPMLANLERQVAQIRDMMRRGWHVLSGTDAPIDFSAISLHLNLRGMVRFGISPHDALLSATRHSGEFLGEPIGRIAPGMLADMILVDGDPLKKIDDVAAVRQVIVNGVMHTPESLMAPFATPQASIAPNAMLAPVRAHQHYWWQEASYVESSRAACCAGHSAHV